LLQYSLNLHLYQNRSLSYQHNPNPLRRLRPNRNLLWLHSRLPLLYQNQSLSW
jgi:hypothetical protein